jgi:HD-GYP domain-containing protein (c-di-GMP phosphodiesterase class II)
MLRMPLGQVKAGMVLAAPVANPKQLEYDLLKAGFELTGQMVERLRDLGVRTVWISYPDLDFLDQVISPKVTQQQQEVYQSLKQGFGSSQKHVVARVDFQEYRRTLSGLIEAIASQHADTLLSDPLMSESGDLMLHCSNVCYLALMMGIKLGHYLVQQRMRLDPRHARDVMNLGLGALLHDIGKMHLPADLRDGRFSPDKPGPPEWQAHTTRGFEMIRGKMEPSATQVALHHHQRWDGSGFPLVDSYGGPLAGERIHVFTRIVAMADQYERQLSQTNAQGLPAVVAMKTLRSPKYRGLFDPVVFKTFSDLVPPFPIGSIVGLSDGGQAVVLIHNADNPCRPTIRRLPDEGKVAVAGSTSFEGEDIQLAEQSGLSIVLSEGVDAEPFLFAPGEGVSLNEATSRTLSLAEQEHGQPVGGAGSAGSVPATAS